MIPLKEKNELKKLSIEYENVFKEKIYDRFFNVKYLCNSFSALLDLSIRLHSENKLRDLIVNNLQEILGDSDFINLPENVRLAQQILSVNPSYALLDKLASLSVNVSLNQIDAVISLALSISETEIDFISFVEKYELETCNFDISELYLFSETLARSPVKANFLSSDFFIRNFWDRLKEDFNYQLLFRCIFFIEENKLNVIKHVDIVKLLHRVISSREKTFVNLYRDVRRSRRIICTEAEVRGLLKTLNLANLSTNKLIFLFSILEPYTAEQEKMLFLSRVMVSKGLPVMNSEVSLTMAASIGLKSLSNRVINDALMSAGCNPCLPTNKQFDIMDIFDCVLSPSKSLSDLRSFEKVSVIITTYNPDLDFLNRSIKSIINQTYKNIEIIVIDDCSDISISYEIEGLCRGKDFQDIRYFRNERNVGQYVSRNIAIAYASGTLIAIQDDDDVSHPQRLEKQVNAILNSGCSVCFTNHIRYSDSGFLSIDDPQHGLVFGDGPASLLFKKQIISKIGGFRSFRSRGDIDFRTRVKNILGEGSVKNLNIPLYFMRSSLKSISSLYEYKFGDQLLFFRKRINLLAMKKASVEECGNV